MTLKKVKLTSPSPSVGPCVLQSRSDNMFVSCGDYFFITFISKKVLLFFFLNQHRNTLAFCSTNSLPPAPSVQCGALQSAGGCTWLTEVWFGFGFVELGQVDVRNAVLAVSQQCFISVSHGCVCHSSLQFATRSRWAQST